MGSDALRALLAADPVSGDIVRFLLQNESARDTVKGIASWWVHSDEIAVRSSLERLFACGVTTAHTLASGTTVYGLTLDQDMRTLLRSLMGLAHRSGPGIASPARCGTGQ